MQVGASITSKYIDFAGPFLGKMYFLVIDAHSKWGEVFQMTQTTTTKTVELLRQLFASYGLPEQVVSDNGPQFVSEEFRQFMRGNGIRHIRCAPYHPASNGLVERFVRTFKEAMKAGKNDGLPLSHRLSNFLLTYRTTPQATTRQTPFSLFLGREARTRFDILKPNLEHRVLAKQAVQKDQHDQHAHLRSLEAGQPVMAKNMRPGENWIPGVILKQLGPVSFLVDVGEGRTWKRHIDHLKVRDLPEPVAESAPEEDNIVDVDPMVEPDLIDPAPDGVAVPAPVSSPLPSPVPVPRQSTPRPVPAPRQSLSLRHVDIPLDHITFRTILGTHRLAFFLFVNFTVSEGGVWYFVYYSLWLFA